MKLEYERPDKSGNNLRIGVFAMHKREAQLIHDWAEHFLRNTPKNPDLTIARNRADTISKATAKWLLSFESQHSEKIDPE